MPLWAQLEIALKARLDAGEFGDRFPTDHELVDEYGVSRHTVREAIRHLNQTGILRRERGRGTIVNRREFEQPLGALYSLFSSVEASGVKQRSSVLDRRETLDPVVAERLGVASDTELFFLERLRFADDTPLALDRSWLLAERTAELLNSNFEHTGLYAELRRLGAQAPDAGWERIAPVLPAPSERRLLQMRRGEAAFSLERFSTAQGTPLEWRTTIIRGDRYGFLSTFAAGKTPGMRAAPTPPAPREG